MDKNLYYVVNLKIVLGDQYMMKDPNKEKIIDAIERQLNELLATADLKDVQELRKIVNHLNEQIDHKMSHSLRSKLEKQLEKEGLKKKLKNKYQGYEHFIDNNVGWKIKNISLKVDIKCRENG